MQSLVMLSLKASYKRISAPRPLGQGHMESDRHDTIEKTKFMQLTNKPEPVVSKDEAGVENMLGAV